MFQISHPGKYLLFALFLLAGGAMQEFAVRLALPDLAPTRHLRFVSLGPDKPTLGEPNTSHRQIKNTGDFNVIVQFNRDGFRDSQDLRDATAEDIFMVGDSFTFGWGVGLADRLSERLAASTGLRIYNLSMPTDVPGYGQLLDQAKSLGAPIRRAIVALSMETDIIDYEHDASASIVPAQSGDSDLQRWKNYLTSNSALYFAATSAIHQQPWLHDAAVQLGLIIPNLSVVEAARFNRAAIDSTVRATSALARTYDAIVVIIPSRGLWHGANSAEFDRIHKEVVAGLTAAGVDLFDLRPSFEAAGSPLSFHFANDPHWRPAGHELAAQALAPVMLRKWPTGSSATRPDGSGNGLGVPAK